VLTFTIGLGNYSLSVLTNPSIRLLSVYNRILPPAPWDTTFCALYDTGWSKGDHETCCCVNMTDNDINKVVLMVNKCFFLVGLCNTTGWITLKFSHC